MKKITMILATMAFCAQVGNAANVMAAESSNVTVNANGVDFTMIAVEGGTFKMGCEEWSNTSPIRNVTLSSYYIGETEVTQDLWEAVMGKNPSSTKKAGFPVESVYKADCIEFCKKLSELTGKKFRLPTEAEWEFAARGGNNSKGTDFSGSKTLDEVAWYTDNSGDELHAVKTLKPNELGIYDMSGNVDEWVSDYYTDEYPAKDETNPQGAQSGDNLCFRGGNFGSWDSDMNLANRFSSQGDVHFNSIGLRLVME